MACGAIVRLSLEIDTGSKRISHAGFRAVGCRVLVAATSLLTCEIQGLTTAEAADLARVVLAQPCKPDIDGQPEAREDCIALCHEALLAAIAEYSEMARAEWSGDEALICTCFGVSERTIERVINDKSLRTVAEVTRVCAAGGGCGSCHYLIEEILESQLRS